jgi:hypothetical protein
MSAIGDERTYLGHGNSVAIDPSRTSRRAGQPLSLPFHGIDAPFAGDALQGLVAAVPKTQTRAGH